MKVLILKPSSLGDVVQALPVLRLLKRHDPAAEVWWWIESSLASLVEGDPDLAGVVRFERRRWAQPRHWGELGRSIRGLRAQRFDWVIDLQSLARSGAVAWLARGGLVVGLDDPREGAPGFFDIAVPRPGRMAHAVDWYLAVLTRLGVPVDGRFEWLPRREEAALAVAARAPADGTRWVAVQPGARWPTKRWPVEHFRTVIREFLHDHPEVRVAVMGGREDQGLGAVIGEGLAGRCVDLTGRTSLPEMIEWVRRCELMVSNDTGPMHVAAALGRPVVALFGPTEPRRTGPYGQVERALRVALPCAPCFKDTCRWSTPMECLRSITPLAVRAAMERGLAGAKG